MAQSKEMKRVKALAKRRAHTGSNNYPIIEARLCNPGELQRLMDGKESQYKIVVDSLYGYGVRYIPTDDERTAWALSY